MNKEKAFILGVMCGDGCLYDCNSCRRLILTTKDSDFSISFKDTIHTLYKKESKIKRVGKYFVVTVYSKYIVNDLKQYSNFKTEFWRVPEEIKQGNSGIKGSFLRGLFDSDGTVENVNNGMRVVALFSINKIGIEEVQSLLNDLHIVSNIYFISHRKGYFKLYMVGRDNLIKFRDKIGFSIKRKQKKLEIIISGYKLIRKRYTPQDYEDVMQLRKKELGTQKIYKSLKGRINKSTIDWWLYHKGKPRVQEVFKMAEKPEKNDNVIFVGSKDC